MPTVVGDGFGPRAALPNSSAGARAVINGTEITAVKRTVEAYCRLWKSLAETAA